MSTHEQAVILNVDYKLGKKPYDLVSIDEIEKCYTTTQAAKVNSYICANPSCGVSVTAVITQKNKLNRKRSPSSYFAAKPKSHIDGCDRQPKPKDSHQTGAGSTSPKEQKSKYRTKWVDPRSQASSGGNMGAVDTQTPPKGGVGDGRGKVRNSTSDKPSQGQSSLVKRFAEDWLSMTVRKRQSTPLDAPWNVGGSYFSALVPLEFYKNREIEGLGERIYSGALKEVVQGRTGITLVLQEPHFTGLPFWIWITSQTFSEGRSGSLLHTELDALIKADSQKEYRVFALGEFIKQTRGTRSWLSLQINHPAMVAILDNEYPD
jgi:hypothetical protein